MVYFQRFFKRSVLLSSFSFHDYTFDFVRLQGFTNLGFVIFSLIFHETNLSNILALFSLTVSLVFCGCLAVGGRSLSFWGWEHKTRRDSGLTALCVSKTLQPHLIHKPLLRCPSLPFITDSVNWLPYLLEPEISWGGGLEWRVASGRKRPLFGI